MEIGSQSKLFNKEEKKEREKNTMTEEQSKFYLFLNSNTCQRKLRHIFSTLFTSFFMFAFISVNHCISQGFTSKGFTFFVTELHYYLKHPPGRNARKRGSCTCGWLVWAAAPKPGKPILWWIIHCQETSQKDAYLHKGNVYH